ncbi:MAG: DnaJ C-terminal domain-containing protein [Aquiluna sp.]|nr:DnaJ C-terminal domain-containing protein [Aquiluna sp.]
MSDHYQVLGVDRDASEDQIKKAYRKLARELHPDINPAKDSQERFKLVTHAYEVLSDAKSRSTYDRGGQEGMGIGDIFDTFFGGSQRGPQSRSQRGQDALLRVDLDLKEAVFGVNKTLTIDTAVLCEDCQGSCCRPGTSPQTCDICRGSGQIQRQVQSFMGAMVTTAPCGTCRGTGEVIPEPCLGCRGQGRVRASRDLDLDIPAGVSDGLRLHLPSQGEVGFGGGPSGDIYLEVSVRSDPIFGRDGDNLVAILEVPIADAALGFEVDVETLDGASEVSVKSGAQHGDIITLKGLGSHRLRGRGRGDLLLQIKVLTPSRLDGKQKDIFRKLRELHKEDKPRLGSRRSRGRF